MGKTKKSSLIILFLFLFGCGGYESYSTPYVEVSNIVVGECRPYDGKAGEEVEFVKDGREVTVYHRNIVLPEGSLLGVEDKYGNPSFSIDASTIYLDADKTHINAVEAVAPVASDKKCYYDLTFRISGISTGTYEVMLWNSNDQLLFSEEMDF